MARGRSSGSRQSKHRVASRQARTTTKFLRAVFQEQSSKSGLLRAGKGPVQERFSYTCPADWARAPSQVHLRICVLRATSEIQPSAACSRLVTALSSHPASHRRHGSPTTWMRATSIRTARSDCVWLAHFCRVVRCVAWSDRKHSARAGFSCFAVRTGNKDLSSRRERQELRPLPPQELLSKHWHPRLFEVAGSFQFRYIFTKI